MKKRKLTICLFFLILIAFMCTGSYLACVLIDFNISIDVIKDIVIIIIVIVAIISYIIIIVIDRLEKQIDVKIEETD